MSTFFGSTLKGNNTFSSSILTGSKTTTPNYSTEEAYEPSSNWILKTRFWNDIGLWEDTALWID